MKCMMRRGQLGLFVASVILCSSTTRAQDVASEPAPARPEPAQPAPAPVQPLDPKLVVGAPSPACTLDTQGLVEQLRLGIARDRQRGPRLVKEWYRGPLAASYLGPPLGFAVVGLTADKHTIAMPVLAGLLGVALPPIIHAAHDNPSGAWYSLLGIIGSVAVGALLGAAVGNLTPGDDSRKEAREHNALVFGYVSYSIWALLDTAFFARAEVLQP